jgi:hypothetical protein
VKISLPVLGPIDDVINPPGTSPTTPHTAGKGADGSDPTSSAHTPNTTAISSEGVSLQYSSACSAHDVPTPRTITLSATQRVTSVGIRCGLAVEGFSFTIGDIDSDIDTGCNATNSSDARVGEGVKGEKGKEDKSHEVSYLEGERGQGKGKKVKGRAGKGMFGHVLPDMISVHLMDTFNLHISLLLSPPFFLLFPLYFPFFFSVFIFVSIYFLLLFSRHFFSQRLHCYGRTEGGREILFKIPEGWAFVGLYGQTGDNLQSLGVIIKKIKLCKVGGDAVDVVMGGEEQDTGMKESETGARILCSVRFC